MSYLAYRLIKPTYQNNYTQAKTIVKNNNIQNKAVVNMDNNPLLESTTNHTKKNNTILNLSLKLIVLIQIELFKMTIAKIIK